MAQYKNYNNIQIEGAPPYIAGVTGCLDTIESIADGKKLLTALAAKAKVLKIEDTTTGNACGALGPSAYPLMTVALKDKAVGAFKTELSAAFNKAKAGGLTLEHLGQQLSVGLTPATYKSAANVVRPAARNPAPSGASPQQIMSHVGGQTMLAMNLLQDLMSGASTVLDLPAGWVSDLPRLLRAFLTPGAGAGSNVAFNHTKTFHCVDDPAMNQRPPAVGLAHELIHALHNASGLNMGLVKQNNQKLEEIITTGMPPYNFEEISDNKMRTQWPSHLELRNNY